MMKQIIFLLLLAPFILHSQDSKAPQWIHTVVSDLPFESSFNNELTGSAEGLMAKKWTRQILNIISETESTPDADNLLFQFYIKDKNAARMVSIPIRIQMDIVVKVLEGDAEALERFAEETESWILRFI